MANKIRIPHSTIALSRKYYLTEVPVENKKTVLFHFLWIYNYSKDAMKIMRTGSCITLLSDFVPIVAKTFFWLFYFEDYVKFVFWTFNGNFISALSKTIVLMDVSNLKTCHELLKQYPNAYDEKLNTDTDEEISYCFRKLFNLNNDEKFHPMFQLDKQNRLTILELLEKRLFDIENGETPSNTRYNPISQPSFADMLLPIHGSIENTLTYMQEKIIEANFPHNIFKTIGKTRDGKNQNGLNSEIAAMVHMFKENGYFKKGFTFKDVFKAFGIYTGNSAGKDLDYASFQSDDRYFEKYLGFLQGIKITRLNSPNQES